MKFIILFLIYLSYISYASDSLYTVSATITNIDSVFQAKFQNMEWDSITTSTNHFVGENDSWYLLQVIGQESSGSQFINKLKGEWKWKR